MDIIASPIVTVILNMVASFLVSKGILDSHSSVAFVQVGNSLIAGLMTTGVAVVSIYKMVDLKKHQITASNLTGQQQISQQNPTVFTRVPDNQSGQPISTQPMSEQPKAA